MGWTAFPPTLGRWAFQHLGERERFRGLRGFGLKGFNRTFKSPTIPESTKDRSRSKPTSAGSANQLSPQAP